VAARSAALAFLAGLVAAPSAFGADYQMTAAANGTSFSPGELTVNPGDSLTVSKEAGAFSHNVYFPDTDTHCPAMPTTSAWSCAHDFSQLGDFVLHCDLHTYMTATVHVVEPGSGTPAPSPTPPAPSPPGTEPPLADVTAPALTLGGADVQRVLRQRAVVVKVRTSEAAALTATGTVRVPAAAALVRLRRATATSPGDRFVTLRLRLSRKARAAVRRGLEIRRRLRASVRVTATDAAGKRGSELRRIALRR
jgi:plastocyanin